MPPHLSSPETAGTWRLPLAQRRRGGSGGGGALAVYAAVVLPVLAQYRWLLVIMVSCTTPIVMYRQFRAPVLDGARMLRRTQQSAQRASSTTRP